MNKRITLPGLVKAMAADTGHTPRQCEEFLRELFALCSAALMRGEDVKVHSIGTFRIVEVEERKSVNVATGEEFVISPHKKVTFVPSDRLAKTANSPFEMFEVVEVPDDFELDNVDEPDVPSDEEMDESSSYDELGDDEDWELVYDSEPELDEKTPSEEAELEETEDEGFDEDGWGDDEEEWEEDEDEEASGKWSPAVTTGAKSAYGTSRRSEEPEAPANQIVKGEERFSDGFTGGVPVRISKETSLPESEETREGEVRLSSGKMRRKAGFGWGMLSGFVLALILGAASYYVYYHWIYPPVVRRIMLRKVVKEDDNSAFGNAENSLSADSLNTGAGEGLTENAGKSDVKSDVESSKSGGAEVDTKASDEVAVTDVISTTRFLTTMARQHYGNDAFWPYIYQENSSFLGHPDHIKPGTKVVVPPLSKYGVDPKNPVDIRKARHLGVEIYDRYNRRN